MRNDDTRREVEDDVPAVRRVTGYLRKGSLHDIHTLARIYDATHGTQTRTDRARPGPGPDRLGPSPPWLIKTYPKQTQCSRFPFPPSPPPSLLLLSPGASAVPAPARGGMSKSCRSCRALATTGMEEAVCKVAVVNFQGKSKPIVCHRSDKCSPLIALTNVMYLRGPEVVADYVKRTVALGYLTDQVEAWAEKFYRSDRNKDFRITKETLVNAVRSLRHHPPLDPLNARCNKFKGSIVVLLFRILGIKVLHGWVLDPTDKKFSLLQGLSYNNLVALSTLTTQIGVSDVQEVVEEDNPAKVFLNASKIQLTTYGLHQLQEELKEGDLAVLYANNEYNVLHKYNGDLFTLETSKDNVTQLPAAMWRKLTIKEEESFYVTGRFIPTKGQQKEKEKLAREWFMAKISAFDDKKSTKKKAELKINLTKELEDKSKDSLSEFVLPISDVAQAEESTKSDVAGGAHQISSEEPSAPSTTA